MAFRIETRIVTPAFARELLTRNAENQRNLRPQKVDQYARDMALGTWPITGDTVKVSTEGTLIDGQHRLAAVVQADVDVEMLIAWDVDPAAMAVLDVGITRTFADVLKMSGSPKRTITSAVVRRVLMWEDGNRLGNTSGGSEMRNPSNPELLARYEKDIPGFDTASARGEDVRRANLGAGGTGGSAFYLFAQLDTDAAHTFFDFYISGANLTEGHPVLTLRNRMVRSKYDERLRAHEVLALFVRSWNAWREGRTLGTISITTGGRKLTNLNFPIPK